MDANLISLEKFTLRKAMLLCSTTLLLCVNFCLGQYDSFVCNVISNSYVEIIKYNGSDSSVIIPETIEDKPVKIIRSFAFAACNSITNIVIPDTIEVIEDWAFSECNNLISITIGNDVKIIGAGALSHCVNLMNLIIPDSVELIGERAFYNCKKLNSITLGKGIKSIGNKSFYFCPSLSTISVNPLNQYYTIVNGVLFNKNKTVIIRYPPAKTNTTYVIPHIVEKIEDGAFNECTNITEVTIVNGVKSIGEYAFEDCFGLKEIVIPDSVEMIGTGIFAGCKNLTSFVIGNGIKNIPCGAFSYCDGLRNIIIPDNIEVIENGAFVGCSRLYSVTIGNGLKTIGDGVFQSCSELKKICFKGNAPEIGFDIFHWCPDTLRVYYVNGTLGWGSTFGGRLTEKWTPAYLAITPLYNYTTNTFRFSVYGTAGTRIEILATTNLYNCEWECIYFTNIINGEIEFVDQNAQAFPVRFYRVLQEPIY